VPGFDSSGSSPRHLTIESPILHGSPRDKERKYSLRLGNFPHQHNLDQASALASEQAGFPSRIICASDERRYRLDPRYEWLSRFSHF
jgi:hypothetical protein